MVSPFREHNYDSLLTQAPLVLVGEKIRWGRRSVLGCNTNLRCSHRIVVSALSTMCERLMFNLTSGLLLSNWCRGYTGKHREISLHFSGVSGRSLEDNSQEEVKGAR